MSLASTTATEEHPSFDPTTAARLQQQLEALGVGAGQRLVVHASLRRLGWIAGGAATLGRVLMALVGPQGLIVMPTFNHGAPFASTGRGVYDPEETPSASGALSDWFWRQPGVRRELHPTHPFAAWGEGAERLLAEEDLEQTLGPHSALGRLARDGGWLLNLGTDHLTSTAKHVAERAQGARCLAELGDQFAVRLPQGRIIHRTSWRYRGVPCPITDRAGNIERALEQIGAQQQGQVGRGRATLTRLDDFVAVVRALLAHGTETAPPCRACRIAPSDRAEGDWA